MTNYDRIKLTKAGYTLLRIQIESLKITQMVGDSAWITYGKYPTKAALHREVERINKVEPKMIFE